MRKTRTSPNSSFAPHFRPCENWQAVVSRRRLRSRCWKIRWKMVKGQLMWTMMTLRWSRMQQNAQVHAGTESAHMRPITWRKKILIKWKNIFVMSIFGTLEGVDWVRGKTKPSKNWTLQTTIKNPVFQIWSFRTSRRVFLSRKHQNRKVPARTEGQARRKTGAKEAQNLRSELPEGFYISVTGQKRIIFYTY